MSIAFSNDFISKLRISAIEISQKEPVPDWEVACFMDCVDHLERSQRGVCSTLLKTLILTHKMIGEGCSHFGDKTKIQSLFTQEMSRLEKVRVCSSGSIVPSVESMGSVESTQDIKQVFAIGDDAGMLIYDPLLSKSILALRINKNRYIKLRDIDTRITEPQYRGIYLSIGETKHLWLSKFDLERAMLGRKNEEAYGSFEEIKKVKDLFFDSTRKVRKLEITESNFDGKLSIQMHENGKFRVVSLKALNKGALKQIYKATLLGEKSYTFAWAKIWEEKHKTMKDKVEAMKLEAEMAAKFHGEKIPHLINIGLRIGQDLRKVRLEMDLKIAGDLRTKVERDTPSIHSKVQRLQNMVQIAEGLAGIHRINHTHSDVKLENFLYDSTNNEAIISDLGESRTLGTRANAGSYPSPEAANPDGGYISRPATKGNDVWAFGMALYAMCNGHGSLKIIEGARWDNSVKKILETREKIISGLDLKDPLDGLLYDIFEIEPQKRPQMTEIVSRIAKILTENSVNDDADALFTKADWYLDGREGFQKDENKARETFFKAASLGNGWAMDKLGYLFEEGIAGCPKDLQVALKYYEQAAKIGIVKARENVERLSRGMKK